MCRDSCGGVGGGECDAVKAPAVMPGRDSCGGVGGGECDAVKVPAVMPGRDSFVRISVTDADDHTTQQITDSRRPPR